MLEFLLSGAIIAGRTRAKQSLYVFIMRCGALGVRVWHYAQLEAPVVGKDPMNLVRRNSSGNCGRWTAVAVEVEEEAQAVNAGIQST